MIAGRLARHTTRRKRDYYQFARQHVDRQTLSSLESKLDLVSIRTRPAYRHLYFPIALSFKNYEPYSIYSTVRWMSSSKGKKETPKDNSSKESKDEAPSGFDPIEHIDRRISQAPIVAQMEQRIKRVVDDLNIADHLSVVSIALLLAVILAAPYVIRQMKQSNSTYEDLTTDDPVDDFTQLVNQEWGIEEGKNPAERILTDVLNSKALQEAAQRFALQLLESPDVKNALNRLLKSLWTDLVTDPETVAQVIKLLQIAIEDPKIKDAARQLVIDLVAEPDVKQSLVDVVEKLGKEDEVRNSTQALLTNSAHRTLNDPEIIEHTMEFASDIVGDDVVQQTAREALWNTVGHAVRPVTTIFLTATGVGLIIFGLVSIGYARSSEQEAVLFETAVRSLQANAVYGVTRLMTWPYRQLQQFYPIVLSVVLYPFHLLQHLVKTSLDAVARKVETILAIPGYVLASLWYWIRFACENLSSRLTMGLVSLRHCASASGISAAKHVTTLFVSLWASLLKELKQLRISTGRTLWFYEIRLLDALAAFEGWILSFFRKQSKSV